MARPAGGVLRAEYALLLPGVSRGAALLSFLLVALLTVASLVLPALLLRGEFDATVGLSMRDLMIEKGGSLAVAIVAALLLTRLLRVPAAAVGWRLDGLSRQLLWIPAVLVGVYVFMIATAAIILSLAPEAFTAPFAPGSEQADGETSEVPSGIQREILQRLQFMQALPSDQTWALLALFMIVGFHEELVFRGLLLPYFRRLTGSWIAAVTVVSVFFGLLHVSGQGWLAAAQVTGVGIVLSVFFILTRSLITVSLAHGIFNFLQMQIARSAASSPEIQELIEQFGA